MKNYLYYFFISINDFLSITFNLDFKDLQVVRFIIGGTWYKQTMSYELSEGQDSWWTKEPLKPNKFHYTEKIEKY